MSSLTQHQKIITALCYKQGWAYPYDFMPPRMDFSNPLCVGYEATARMAELRKKYPEMIETKADGKYKCSRIRRETVADWFTDLPKDLRQIVAKGLDYYPHIPGNKYAPKIVQQSTPSGPNPFYQPEQGKLL